MSWRTKAITFKELNEIYQGAKFRSMNIKCPKCGMLNGKAFITSKGIEFRPVNTQVNKVLAKTPKEVFFDCIFCSNEIKIKLRKI